VRSPNLNGEPVSRRQDGIHLAKPMAEVLGYQGTDFLTLSGSRRRNSPPKAHTSEHDPPLYLRPKSCASRLSIHRQKGIVPQRANRTARRRIVRG